MVKPCTNIKMNYTGLVVCMSPFCMAISIGWASSAVNCAMVDKSNDYKEWNFEYLKWLPVLHTIGGLILMIPGYKLCNFFGPKCAMTAFMFPGLMGWLLITIPHASFMAYLAICMIGGSSTACWWIGRVYLTHISQNGREEMVFLNKIMFSLGLVYIFALGCLLKSIYLLNLFSILPSVLCLCGTFTIPESPLYLLKEGHFAPARKALSRLRPKDHDLDLEMEEKLDFLLTLKSKGYMKFKKVFTKAHQQSFRLEYVLYFLRQMTGMEMVYFYSGMLPIYENETPISLKYLPLIYAIFVMIFSYATFQLSSYISIRNQSILSSLLLSIIGFAMTFYATCYEEGKNVLVRPWILVVCFILYNCAYNIGYNALPIIIAQQLFDKGVEHVVVPVLQTADLIFRLLVIIFYLSALPKLGFAKVVAIFTIFNVLSIIFTAFHLPRVGVSVFTNFDYDIYEDDFDPD